MTDLSQHFTLEELTYSQMALRLGLDNTPGDTERANLIRLCFTLLEPIRTLLGVPVHVDSGFRSSILNTKVGGAINSAHLEGRAADLVPIGMALETAFNLVRRSGLPLDQVITECNAWIHVAIAKDGELPRGQALAASGGPGAWKYTQVA